MIIDLKSKMIKYNWIKGIVKAVIARSADMRRCIWREAKGNLTDISPGAQGRSALG